MIDITVMVPVDKTDYKKVIQELKASGMIVEEVRIDLGVIHGRVKLEENTKAIVALDSVAFVSRRRVNYGSSYSQKESAS